MGDMDQSMRNHSVQYTAEPNYGWNKLRRQWPWVYEAWANLKVETWTKIRIEVKGRSARLFVNGSEQPSLVVDGLKGDDLRGGIALWQELRDLPVWMQYAAAGLIAIVVLS